MMRIVLVLVLLAGFCSGPLLAQPGATVRVAAASDLQTALPVLAAGFERKTGIKATITFGSSGNFFAQIQNGAPFDVFFSADADYPRKLAASGHLDPPSVYEYAIGGLVLWTRKDSSILLSRGMTVLGEPHVKRVAIANPDVAPYGRAAVAALRSAGVYGAVQPKLVFAENVSQAAQMAESGNADVALIGHALARDGRLSSSGRFVSVPPASHPPILQAAGIVSASRSKTSARALLDYIKTTEAHAILRSFGFEVPGTTR